MTQEVPSLFRDSAAPSAAVDASARAPRSADPSASDAAKEARLLSQLLLLFSVKRQHSAVAALFPHHIESSPDGHFAFVDAGAPPAVAASSVGLAASPADASSASAAVLDAHVHPATDAALATSLLRTRPSERELVQQFLLLPQTSRNKVAQSLFVVPPSLLEDFAVILQFFLRVIIESHSDSRLHHYDAAVDVDEDEGKRESVQSEDDETLAVPEKTCSWARNGDVGCVSYEPDEAQAATTDAGAAASTTAVFRLPEGFQACLVEVYGSVHRSKCEEVWHGDHMAYRCRTCGLSDSSCMCLACFDPEDHEGHDYRVYRCSSGGCCDCGDPLAWKPDGFCKKHRKQAIDDEPEATLGALEHAVIYGLVRRVVAFCMNALREVYTFCLRPGGAGAVSASFDAFYPQTQTMRVLPKTGRRRSSFPSVMQVHIDRLQQCLAWLQSLAVSCLPYRQIVTGVFLESLPPDFQLDGPSSHPLFETFPPRPLAILDIFLKAGVLVPVEVCDTLGVLYLKLLFDQPFKQQYTCHFVDWYPYFIELYLTASEENNDEGMRNLSRFIDRLFCQLFHSTAQLRELERASKERAKAYNLQEATSSSVVQRLLVLLLGKLIGLFKNTLRVELVPARGNNNESSTTLLESVHVVDCGRNVFKKRVYARLCSDIRTLLVHPLVAGEVLLDSFDKVGDQLQLRDSSVYALLIQAYETLQQMDMQQRHVQQHIEFESQNWTFAFVVDYEMNLLLGAFLAGLPHCFQDGQDEVSTSESAPSSWEVARALVSPLRHALLRWSTRSGSGSWQHNRTGEEHEELDETELEAISRFYQYPPRTNDQTPRTAKKSSFHLPLHHMFAAVFKGVSPYVGLRSLGDWTRLLFDRDCRETNLVPRSQRDEVVFLFQAAEYPLRVATFAREIKAGLWVRNGNVMWQQLVHYYAKHWRYYGLHGDIFVSQLSALLLPRGSITRMLIQHQAPLIKPLLDRKSESSLRHESELLEETLRLAIQLVLSPLRFPTSSSSLSHEEWATWLLEREVKHWLSLGPFSRSEMVSHLDLKLVEQVRQMARHEWFLLEEEEIIGHVLDRVGEYDDPYGRNASGGDQNAAAALGFGMKMSGTWRLKDEFWRQISPLFECFSPSESQLCEQNLKKHQLRNRVKIEEACLLPVPRSDENLDYFVSSQHLASQILNSPSIFAVVQTVLINWLDENCVHGKPTIPEQADGKRNTSENLVVAAIQCLSVAVQLLDCGADGSGETSCKEDDCHMKGFHQVEHQFATSVRQDFYSQLCLELDIAERTTGLSTSILSSLEELQSSTSLSPDTRVLARLISESAAKKSAVCHEYIEARKRKHIETASSDGRGTTALEQHTPLDKQQLAKDMMRRRQQEILAKMRSQQQKFLSSQTSANMSGSDEQDDDETLRDREEGNKFFEEERADECDLDGDEDEEACLSTEYEEEDEDEDDEWGFPAGHIDLELYLSHVASAVSQISDRERKLHRKGSRRSRRRTQSRVRADSLGGVDAASSPSISVSSLEQDEDAEAEECALCRLPCESPSDKDSTFGYVAVVQPTSLPHKLGLTADSSQLPLLRTNVEISDRDGNINTTTLESACNGDSVVWTCGHAIHHSCIKAYIDSLWKQQRANRNPLEALHHHGDERLLSERDLEFLCPVCRRLSNCLIPDVTPLLRLRTDDFVSSFSLRSASSFGEDPDSLESEASVSDGSRHSFTKWLRSAMVSNTGSPYASPSLTSRPSSGDSDVAAILFKRVGKFCKQLKLRCVRASLQLPLLLSGFADDELVIDSELRHVAETWGQQFSDWKLLLRSLEVELDLTLFEQDLSEKIHVGALPDRHRLQSLRLLSQTSVAAAMATDASRYRNRNALPNLEQAVASTSEVLFGKRVLFAEDDDEIQELTSLKPLEPENAPLLSHPHLFEVFSNRLTALLAVSATRCSKTSEDYRYTETLLSDVFFSARVVVSAQILQALCSAALTLPLPPQDSVSPPRSPGSRQTPRSRRIITDFTDVETLGDAMQWAHLLMVRCRLLPASSMLAVHRMTWDMAAVEKRVVDHVLPLLRRMVLLIQASLPRVLDGHDRDGGDPCALCDDLYSSGNAEFASRATGSSRTDLRALMRRLHLPPLRFFFRGMVFSTQQRELCQLWAAQMESKAAVLRRHQHQEQLKQDTFSQQSPPLVSLLVPSTIGQGRERRRLFIDLPKVYMELFIKYNDKTQGQCQRCHQVPQHPAICLFCGDVVCCFSQCCESTQGGRIGECTQHAQTCAQGTGAFLLLRACTVILFLGNARRCVWGSLYVDKNGEEDPYLRRGRTLFLAPHRLLALETLLVSHGFAQNTAILANTSRRDGRRY